MATYQTSFSELPAKGLHGQIANTELSNRISRTVENAGGIKFGTPVQRGSGDHGVVPFAASGKFMGIAILDIAVPAVAPGATLVDGYPQYVPTAAFMTKGQMYVRCGASGCADGDPVYYNTVTERYVNAAGTNIVGPFPNAFFDTTGVDGDIVEISLMSRGA